MAEIRNTKKLELQNDLKTLLGGWLPPRFYCPTEDQAEWVERLKNGTLSEDPSKPTQSKPTETDEEIDARLRERFEVMDMMVQMAIAGDTRSVTIYGSPGLGKSYNVEKALREYDPTGKKYDIVRGKSTPPNVVKCLWDNRQEGRILVFDDCDAIFDNEDSLNILKAATDSGSKRRISWLSEGVQLTSDNDASRVAKSFDFHGTVIFITNRNLDAEASSGRAKAEHYSAMISRSDYIDLTLTSRRDAFIRIKQVAKEVFAARQMKPGEAQEVIEYITTHQATLRTLDLRTLGKIAGYRKMSPSDWKRLAKIQCFRAKDYVESEA